jgi:hypothetical protein
LHGHCFPDGADGGRAADVRRVVEEHRPAVIQGEPVDEAAEHVPNLVFDDDAPRRVVRDPPDVDPSRSMTSVNPGQVAAAFEVWQLKPPETG